MDLSDHLISQVKHGRAILFLGAGASYGAKLPNGASVPLGDQLKGLISDNFLGGKHKDSDLSWIAELAQSESDLIAVQNFIADQFRGLIPAEYHKLIPTFLWRGIATTNYDRLIETVYNIWVP